MREEGVYYPGPALADFELPYVGPAIPDEKPVLGVTTWEECCEACEETTHNLDVEKALRCHAWTFKSATAECHLKTDRDFGQANAIADVAFVSGAVCGGPCASDEYELLPCGLGTDRVCARCSPPMSCPTGYFESQACSETSDRLCSRCEECDDTAGYLEDPPCKHECDPTVAPSGMPSVSVRTCSDGTYRNGDESVAPWLSDCPGFSLCKPGFYCDGESMHPCPPGRYGAKSGSNSPRCDGKCDAGYYCTGAFDSFTQLFVGSVTPQEHPCGNVGVYCPAGSFEPTPVRDGYYTTGRDAALVAAGASLAVTNATRTGEKICEPGFYCMGGVKQPCPGGTYGGQRGLTTPECSGQCLEGWYCPAGSKRAREIECGNGAKHNTAYCPTGSAEPLPLYEGQSQPEPPSGVHGHYSTGGDDEHVPSLHRNEQHECPLGHYCVGGQKLRCPRGRYGIQLGMVESDCSGICEPGYYCPEASITAREVRCGGNHLYCPEGSGEPTPVSEGHYTVGGGAETRSAQQPCEPGFWCTGGERFVCNQGHYGDEYGQSDPDCSGLCHQGYYCTTASTSPTQNECGGEDVYCPEGSFEPHPVPLGYYSVRVVAGADVHSSGEFRDLYTHPDALEQFNDPALHRLPPASDANSHAGTEISTEIVLDDSNIRTNERLCDEGHYCVGGRRFQCPPGRWGGERMLSTPDCSGNCTSGYICPWASTRPTQVQCGGNDRYCLPDAYFVTPVTEGYYTTGGSVDGLTRDNQTICEPGWYCRRGIRIKCPAGRYGATPGLSDDACSGLCEAGFYCPEASTSPQQIECGGVDVFCPEGSKEPLAVYPGYYTVGGRNTNIPADRAMYCRETYGVLDSAPPLRGPFHLDFDDGRYCTSGQIGDNETRSTQKMCEPGHFCVGGLRYECPPGTYGVADGETNPQCTGFCPDGYYCPWASTSKFEEECGAADLYCPSPSGSPTPVNRGWYSVTNTFETTRYQQSICPVGHYCVNGEKFPCAPGRYGDVEGLYTDKCSGLCSIGYYCPVASFNHTQNECGHVGVYCPIGSFEPRVVPEGYYTTGGWEGIAGRPENTTRDWFELCEVGHYCTGGIKRQCPSRVFGNATGLASPDCTGICPAGYFCPPYTIDPFQYECGNISLPITDESFTVDGAAISGGFHGAAAVAGPNTDNDPFLVAWYNGVRSRVPTANIDVSSPASIHNLALLGGPSSFFCPEGSDWPTPVRAGYYTVGGELRGDNRTRSKEVKCEEGYYCVAGIKSPCPPGTYGNQKKLSTRYCTAQCPPGFECPEASAEPTECEPNFYSSGGFPNCMECPTPLPEADPRYPHIRPRCRDSRLCCNY